MAGEPKKVGLEPIFTTLIHGDDAFRRSILEHGDGRWSIAVAKRDGTGAEIEHTFTLAEVSEWAEKAFSGDPAARQKKGLGPILAGANLLMMLGLGIIKAEKVAP